MTERGTQNSTGTPYAGSAETHAGVVFFAGERAYKLKKPVDLGFLDFRKRSTRSRILHREYELNRRLAPDVYLGVADIGVGGDEPCEHVLVMRRMPADRSLASLIDRGTEVDGPVREVARTMAGFHSCTERRAQIDREGTPEAVRSRWNRNLDGLREFTGELLDTTRLDEIADRGGAFLDGRAALLRRRRDERRIVDGHGDLLAEDIFCLDDGPRILDCLEFDDRLRWLDQLDDAACLAMDIEYHGDPALARRFLDTYTQFVNDNAPNSLGHFYIAYRALVRAKVACLKHGPGDDATARDAREHLRIAVEHLRSAATRLVLVGGPPGSGKSTVSEHLADRLGATLLSTDRIRKELLGVSPAHSAASDYESGAYGPEHTEQTYAELTHRAGILLGQGETVVLDASWTRGRHRQEAERVAAELHAELVAVRCTAPEEVLTHRVETRTDSISDADPAVARRLAAEADPWPQAHPVDTAGSVDRALREALRLFQPS